MAKKNIRSINGYSNMDTWAFALHLDNDPEMHRAFYLILKRHYDRGLPFTAEMEGDFMELANFLQVKRLLADTLDLDEINYTQIAQRMLENLKEGLIPIVRVRQDPFEAISVGPHDFKFYHCLN